MQKNVKLGLAYLLPVIVPLIFLFVLKDNDEEDKRQLSQALVLDIALFILGILVNIIAFIPVIGTIISLATSLIGVATLILAILYFTGKTYQLPVLYDLGKGIASSVK